MSSPSPLSRRSRGGRGGKPSAAGPAALLPPLLLAAAGARRQAKPGWRRRDPLSPLLVGSTRAVFPAGGGADSGGDGGFVCVPHGRCGP